MASPTCRCRGALIPDRQRAYANAIGPAKNEKGRADLRENMREGLDLHPVGHCRIEIFASQTRIKPGSPPRCGRLSRAGLRPASQWVRDIRRRNKIIGKVSRPPAARGGAARIGADLTRRKGALYISNLRQLADSRNATRQERVVHRERPAPAARPSRAQPRLWRRRS